MVVQYAINMIENIDRITLEMNKRDGLGRNLCNKTLLYSFRFKYPFYHLCEVRDKYCQQYWWHNIETCYHQFCKSNTHVQITRIYVCKKWITINGKRQYLDLFQLSPRVGFILLSILSSQRNSFFDLCFKKFVNRVLGHKRNSRYYVVPCGNELRLSFNLLCCCLDSCFASHVDIKARCLSGI